MRITFAYLETFWTEHLDKDRYEHVRLGTDLPIGLGTVRAFAELDAAVRRKTEMVNRTFQDGTPEEEVLAELRKTAPEMVAFSLYLWNAPRTYRICERLKDDRPCPRIVVGGPEVPRGEEKLRAFMEEHPYIDAAVCGEGEEAFAGLLKAAVKGAAAGAEAVPGLGLRKGKDIVVTPPRAEPVDLAKVPSPYLNGSIAILPSETRMVCVETSRGCPFSCAYCDYHAGRRKMRHFPIQRLERELELLHKGGFRGCVYIADPFLNLEKERVLKVFRVLQRWPNRFHMELKAELFDDELVSALGKVPLSSVAVGIQSTHAPTLKNIQRAFDLEAATGNIRKLLAHPNVLLDLEFILGLPGDNYETFRRSMDWALSFSPLPQLTLFDLVLLPNSPLASMKERFSLQVDPEGLVHGSSSFSPDDMMRASWLFAAYCWLRNTSGFKEKLEQLLHKPGVRPSAVLEKVGLRLVETGFLPKERIIGQGGRRPDTRGQGEGGKRPKRWIELSKLGTGGVEAEAWW